METVFATGGIPDKESTPKLFDLQQLIHLVFVFAMSRCSLCQIKGLGLLAQMVSLLLVGV
eukprot:3223075-Amphidinium_carterae.1